MRKLWRWWRWRWRNRERRPVPVSQPVQIECELRVIDCNGCEAEYTHTMDLPLFHPETLYRKMGGHNDGSSTLRTGLTNGVTGYRAEARFRRVQ